HARRAALSGAVEGAGAGARALQGCRTGVVPGRAAQHGFVALHRALSGMGAEPDPCTEQASALRRTRGIGGHRDRFDVKTSGAAQGSAGRSAELEIAEAVMPALVAGIHVLIF